MNHKTTNWKGHDVNSVYGSEIFALFFMPACYSSAAHDSENLGAVEHSELWMKHKPSPPWPKSQMLSMYHGKEELLNMGWMNQWINECDGRG